MHTTKNRAAAFLQIFPSELKDAARTAHEGILEALGSMNRRPLVQLCAKSLGVPDEQDANRLIWHGIVRYANADLNDAACVAEAFLAFQAFSTLCVIRLHDPFDTAALSDLPFDDLESVTTEQTLATFEGFFDACCHQLSTLHSEFRTMLMWLTDPNVCSRAQRNQAIKFLLEHGGEGTIRFDVSANDTFDDSGDKGAPFFYWKSVRGYRTIFSPVAKFILDRLEQYHADEKRSRLTLSEAVPLLCCKRLGCRRFAVLRRRTKDFCSASCRTLYRQEAKPEEHAAYQRKYRKLFTKARKDRKTRRR